MKEGLEAMIDAMNPVARGADMVTVSRPMTIPGATTEVDSAGKIVVLEHFAWLEKTALSIEEANHLWQERLCRLYSPNCSHEICRRIRWKLDAVRNGYYMEDIT